MYIPLATKYRPQKFADVVGQDIVVKILTRGIQKDRLGAALLFAGTRGVGKTTLARIVAKSLRCEGRDPNDPEPCCKCRACLEFLHNSQMDVIEIDAASNTSVDDVREIIENCRYKPTTGKYKIFIIDEVHMLSKSAFNALLKTLEEPPEHVKFLFATTETYKVPETILSRVLRFDLKNLEPGLIAQHLSAICNQEGISAEAEALALVAKAANGSVRDSLSILDQAIDMADNNSLTLDNVRDMLNVTDDSDTADLLEIIIHGNVKAAIEKYRSLISAGAEPSGLINVLMDFVHALACIKSNVGTSVTINKLKELAQNVSLAALSKIWQMLIKGSEELKFCDRPEIVLEMIIMRICYAAPLPDLDVIVKQIMNGKGQPSPATKKDNFSHVGVSLSTTEAKKEASDDNDLSLDDAMKMFPGAKLQK